MRSQTIALLGEWRRLIDANRGIAVAAGMAVWKRREIERFLWAGPRAAAALRRQRRAPRCARRRSEAGAIAVWPSRRPPGLDRLRSGTRIPIHTVEDGFIRSVGLGAACVPPLSIAVDSQGIHYDPSRPSDLETILADHAFTPAELARAEALIAFVVEHGIGKYDGDHAAPAAPEASRSRPRILVTGQVEDDLSVRLGGAGGHGQSRPARPRAGSRTDAELWYRPHPDVDAGLRLGAVPDADALRYAERVARGGSMARLLGQVDGIHVLTSLAGFEALLRGLPVTVHGQPFFAGWGLTRDFAATMFRRKRRLSLPELVAGVLILYPRYIDPVTGLPCPPERMTNASFSKDLFIRRYLRAPGGCKANCSERWDRGDRMKHIPSRPRSFLFLQGPPGPFFARLGAALQAAGHAVHRINFNGGDRVSWPERAPPTFVAAPISGRASSKISSRPTASPIWCCSATVGRSTAPRTGSPSSTTC
jgi:capsular polysaccharide export protein